ncbi:ABC transporter permease subunit [Clostridium sp. CM027]|uniref:ABC transporter permease/substrate-binding protein n=1 Tax=Clostridium sp. CM027 TaxID=2849865 RepID=UPI001C6EC2D3|nr:glycine betaine ABC transporter substrate-binding protein [Clostridium sp. CM027]MBW9146032.1 ABC transporter permease subunit [Clostridium sp. CM027]UVE39502.1 ABC transporter permease subunit [Clostridium sp. CM027]
MGILNGIVSFKDFVVSRQSQIIDLTLQHIELTVFAVVIAIIIGIPLGILISRVKKLSGPVIGLANLIQAIPSLALLGFLIPILGIGSTPAILMVFLYSLLPIIKNTYTGLMNINPDVIESSKGMGMTNKQVLKLVQLPLAFPVIMTGIRISAVTAVGLMTIAAFIGAGGLGYMVFSGVQTVDNNMILAGAIPACLLALLMDSIVEKIEQGVTPPGIRKADGTIKLSKRKKHKFSKTQKIIARSLAMILIASGVYMSTKKTDTIVVGCYNSSEQIILGNILATLIEKNTDIKVETHLNLGGSGLAYSALKTGEIDMYPEYTGMSLVGIMKRSPINDPAKAYKIVSDYYIKNYGITWLKPLGFNDTYTLSVGQDTAKKYNLETISDLAKVGGELNLGATLEFCNRADGYSGLTKVYNLKFKSSSAIDGGLRYTALDNKKVDAIDAFKTEGLLKSYNLKVLKDDKNFFPNYDCVPIVSSKTLEKHPELKPLINKLGGKITKEKMIDLNYKVDKLSEEPAKVAEDFLRENKLIK